MANTLPEKLRQALRLKLALSLVWAGGPGWTFANVVLLVLQGLLPLVSVYLMKLIVDAVSIGFQHGDSGAAFQKALLYIALAGAVAVLGEVLRTLARFIAEAQGEAVTDHVSDVLHAKSVEVDLEYYEDPQYHDTLHRAQREAPYRPTRILNGLVQLGQSGISLGAMVFLLFSFHWAVAAVLFAAAVPGLFVRLKHSEKMFRWFRDRTPAERRAWYYNWILTTDRYAKELRLFGLGPLVMQRFQDVRRELREERMAIAARRYLAEGIAGATALLAVYGSLAFIALRAVQGAISIGDLVMYFQAFQRGQGYLRDVLASLAGLYEDNLFLSHLQEFLAVDRKVEEPTSPVPVPRPMAAGLVYDRVGFRYPSGSREVLNDVSLRVAPGEIIALVGENGSGKTTLIKLLSRLYDPTEGRITLDGKDIRGFATVALRREINVIFQDFAQYHLSARDNIWFGDVALPPDDERIAAAARRAGADEVIERLPAGYDTVLGKRFGDGEELSVGEWQKVALARAFLRDAQIIVLDEPTSSMDAKAEYEFFDRFRGLVDKQAVILISHRFSTVRMADRIYVLERGRIIEEGSHDRLMNQAGTYARLFALQAKHYQ